MLRRKIILILFGLALAAPALRAEDAKDLSVITVALNKNASLVVADEQGNLTGVDPTIPKMYQDIPESSSSDVPATHLVSIFHPQGAAYQLFVFGTAIGSYHLEMTAYSRDGTPQPKIALNGDTAPGVKTIYDITFKPDWSGDNDASTIVLHQ